MNINLVFSDTDLVFAGAVNVSVVANPVPSSVDYYVDNVFKASRNTGNFSWTWDTTTVADGAHVVKAIGSYKNGRTVTDIQSVTVRNAATVDATPPSVPGSFTNTAVTDTSAAVTWNASTDNVGVVGYNMYLNGNFVVQLGSSARSYNYSNLQCGTSYSLSVEAFDAAGNKSAKSTINATTSACTPATPTWTSSIADGASVVQGTTWTVTVSPTPTSVEFWQTINGVNTLMKTDTAAPYDVVLNLSPGTYILGICVWINGARACFEDRKTVTITAAADTTAPSAPTNLRATAASSSQITLSWTASTDNIGVAGYLVERQLSGGSFTQVGTPSGTSFTDSGLVASTAYTYRVRAKDAAGNLSSYSSTASATTLAATAHGYTYFDSSTWNTFTDPPWESIQTDVDWNGAGGPSGETQVPSGHVRIGAAPDGNGKAVRFYLPDNDPPWPIDTSGKRSQIQMEVFNTWNENAYTPGEVRWFEFEIYLPWNNPTGEYFEIPNVNGDWFTLIGLHPNTSGVPGWGCFDIIRDYPAPNPIYLTHNLQGGTYPAYPQVFYNAIQLTNSDGTPYMPNYNRRIHLVMGGKFAPDTTGWSEIWVDGVRVVQVLNHPTTWTGDYSTYFKFGPYINAAAKFPHGSCTVYLCKLNIGSTRPF